MSATYRLLSELKSQDVINITKVIGFDIEHQSGTFELTYFIGNEKYGWSQVYSKGGLVIDFTTYGDSCEKSPIDILRHCFNFMDYNTDINGKSPHDHELATLSNYEFFAKHHPRANELYDIELQRILDFEVDYPDLHNYVHSKGRTLNSYSLEYAHVNKIHLSQIIDIETVAEYISQLVT